MNVTKYLMKLDTKRMFILTSISIVSTLSIIFALILSDIYVPLVHTLNNKPIINSIIYEFLPIGFMIIVLLIIRMKDVEIKNNKYYGVIELAAVILIAMLSMFVFFRAVDVIMMLIFSSTIYSSGSMLRFTEVSFHIIFYTALSFILLVTAGVFFKKKGLISFFPIYIIPIFYTFNADVIMRASEFSLFSFFYPVYQFILEFGRLETQLVGSILNFFNIETVINVGRFPYSLFCGNTLYFVDLPCIGWEGIMGYTIIFLNLIIFIEPRNKRRLIWGILGIMGTIFMNIIRLTLIFSMGALFDVQVAVFIHQHMGDVIFIIWIFVFILIMDRFKNFKPTLFFERLKTLLKR